MLLLKLKLDDVENPNSSVNQSELSSDISEFLSKRERYQTLVEMCHYFYDFPFWADVVYLFVVEFTVTTLFWS